MNLQSLSPKPETPNPINNNRDPQRVQEAAHRVEVQIQCGITLPEAKLHALLGQRSQQPNSPTTQQHNMAFWIIKLDYLGTWTLKAAFTYPNISLCTPLKDPVVVYLDPRGSNPTPADSDVAYCVQRW